MIITNNSAVCNRSKLKIDLKKINFSPSNTILYSWCTNITVESRKHHFVAMILLSKFFRIIEIYLVAMVSLFERYKNILAKIKKSIVSTSYQLLSKENNNDFKTFCTGKGFNITKMIYFRENKLFNFDLKYEDIINSVKKSMKSTVNNTIAFKQKICSFEYK
ncbi:MAG: hypothetical protein HRU35_03600 [Rickettsiaceae bacterium]|nr:hypothetical protein [Rickettsiaceae bacterium]